MPTVVKTRIVKIGNSQGIRIPRLLLEQTNLTSEVELEVHPDQIIVRAMRQPRSTWDAAFQEMASQGDDKLLDEDTVPPTDWEADEWEW